MAAFAMNSNVHLAAPHSVQWSALSGAAAARATGVIPYSIVKQPKAHARALAAPDAPELCIPLREQRAQETPGVQPHPRPRVRNEKAHEQSHHRFQPGSPGVSCAMVLTAYSALSLVSRACCHHRRRDAEHHRQLDASVGASGPHGFAVRRRRCSSLSTEASIASRPTFVTMANVPLSDETREAVGAICPTG